VHRRAARPRSHPIALQFQLLWHSISITTSSPEVVDRLRYLIQHADQAVPAQLTMSYDVRPRGDGFAVTEEGDALAVEPDADAVLDVLYRRIHQRAFEFASLRGWVRVHGAVADVNGRRVLLVGPSGVGKSTLSLRMLFDGMAVQGDESALLRDGRVLAVPRRFHLKPGVDDVVPEVAAGLTDLPSLDGQPPVRAFDPAEAGMEWRIDEGQVDEVVLLDAAHGGRSSLDAASASASMHEIVEQVFPNRDTRAAVLREVAALLRRAQCSRLTLGDVREAATLLETRGRPGYGYPTPGEEASKS
jgi:hypothetical protein